MLITVCAWYLIVLCAINVFAGPFLIGQPRKPFSATSWLVQVVMATIIVVVSGRVLGWW